MAAAGQITCEAQMTADGGYNEINEIRYRNAVDGSYIAASFGGWC